MRILRDLISPTLSSFRGLKPHHDTRDDAVNIFMSAPISANMEAGGTFLDSRDSLEIFKLFGKFILAHLSQLLLLMPLKKIYFFQILTN